MVVTLGETHKAAIIANTMPAALRDRTSKLLPLRVFIFVASSQLQGDKAKQHAFCEDVSRRLSSCTLAWDAKVGLLRTEGLCTPAASPAAALAVADGHGPVFQDRRAFKPHEADVVLLIPALSRATTPRGTSAALPMPPGSSPPLEQLLLTLTEEMREEREERGHERPLLIWALLAAPAKRRRPEEPKRGEGEEDATELTEKALLDDTVDYWGAEKAVVVVGSDGTRSKKKTLELLCDQLAKDGTILRWSPARRGRDPAVGGAAAGEVDTRKPRRRLRVKTRMRHGLDAWGWHS